MCTNCSSSKAAVEKCISRRQFVSGMGVSAVALTAGSVSFSNMALAASSKGAVERNPVSADQALELLQEGNKRYYTDRTINHKFEETRGELTTGQQPYAVLITCSDSRVAPEITFDTTLGEIFVIRVAGNMITTAGLATIEYAVGLLGTNLVMVMGHTSCGAISAAVNSVKTGKQYPGKLPQLVEMLVPPVKKAQPLEGDFKQNAMVENVNYNVDLLKNAGPVVSKLVEDGTVKIVGSYYDLHTGKVNMLG